MPTPEQTEAFELSEKGHSQRDIANLLGISRKAVWNRIQAYKRNIQRDTQVSPEILSELKKAGITDTSALHSGWVFPEVEGGRSPSLYFKFPEEEGSVLSNLADLAKEAADVVPPVTPFEPRPTGDGMLIYNLADVHTGRLCTVNQSGFDYSGKTALSRVIEGTEQLLDKAKLHGIGHIILTVGNDKMHFDNLGQTTTNGTKQESDTNLCNMYRNAMVIDRWVIQRLMKEGNVTIVHVPSNHDRVLGFTLAQQHLAVYKDHEQVTINEYLASERDRKYVIFNQSINGFTHGDAAKDHKLGDLMTKEAHDYISSTDYYYWYLAHLHHKVRKKAGMLVEKDEELVTIVGPKIGDAMTHDIEIARAPAPADWWHDRMGYTNRQAVELYMHDPSGAQVARFTEWF